MANICQNIRLYIKPDSVANTINSYISDADLGQILRRAAGSVVDELPDPVMEALAVCIRNDCDAYREATERKNGGKKTARDRAAVARPPAQSSKHPLNRPFTPPPAQSFPHSSEEDANSVIVDIVPEICSDLSPVVGAELLDRYCVGEQAHETPPPEVFCEVCERSLNIPNEEWTDETRAEIDRIYNSAILGIGASAARKMTPIKNWIAYTVTCLISSYEKKALRQCKGRPRGLTVASR